MIDWRFYYDDGSTFDNEHGTFEDAPADGVVGCVQCDKETGREVWQAFEYYFMFENGEVCGTNDLGPLLRRLGIVKFGRWMPEGEYKGTLKRMIEDPDFPRKSAKRKRERL